MVDHCAARRAYSRQILMHERRGTIRWHQAARDASSVCAFVLALLWIAIFAVLVAQLFTIT
jgi:hypothetical protein